MVDEKSDKKDEAAPQPDFWQELKDEIAQLWNGLGDGWNSFTVGLRNRLRALRRAQVDYVILPISGSLPERAQPPRSFIQRQLPLPPLPLSMEQLNGRLRAIAAAGNVKGVVFVLQELDAGLATLQNFRTAVQRLRDAGKEAIVYTPELDLPHYFAATAADRIIVPPSAQFSVFGLRAEVVFLREALAQIGVAADVVPISPYKTAGNQLGEADITPEQREQLNWLLDEQYDLITAGMAAGRGMTQSEMQSLIDRAPIFAGEALAHSLVDDLAYEDELPYLLAKSDAEEAEDEAESEELTEEGTADSPANAGGSGGENNEPERAKATLLPWSKAAPLLMEKARRRPRKFIGVISLEGTIVMGPSRRPPVDFPLPLVGGAMAGEETLVKLLRRAEQTEQMAALIFHVDSPGGSALASDLIGRQIKRLAAKKPVLVYMGNVAASGGYYVSAAADQIMSQSGTTTGSIGVINIRLGLQGLLERLHVNQVNLDRGERVGLYRNITPMTEAERALFQASIEDVYRQFKQIVADGRDLPLTELDPICKGKVWSGRQALGHRLVDEHGDFVEAVRRAADLAGLPRDDEHEVPVANFYPDNEAYLPPQPFPSEAMAEIGRLLLQRPWQQFNGQPLMFMPFNIRYH